MPEPENKRACGISTGSLFISFVHCIGLSFVNRIPLFTKYTTLFITVQPSVIGRNDLCLHKDQTALLRMCRAPDNEQRSGVSRGSARQRGFANGAG